MTTLIWSFIAAIGVADLILLSMQNMTVAIPWLKVVVFFAFLILTKFYRFRADFIAKFSNNGAQLVAFSWVAALLTYSIAAASPFPLMDNWFTQADEFLGFSWITWFEFVRAHFILHFILALE